MKTYKPRGRYHLMAEWEKECAILVTMPSALTDWAYILDKAKQQCRDLVHALLAHGQQVILLCNNEENIEIHPHPLLKIVSAEYNDTWTRDYGPLSVSDGNKERMLDFGFNAWGLKFAANKDNLVNLQLSEQNIFPEEYIRNCRKYILEGGSVETDGKGTLLTTSRCLCSPNRNGGLSKQEVNEAMRLYLGIEHVLWLEYGALEGDDTDSHIDTLARMAPHDTIVYTGSSNSGDWQDQELKMMADQLKAFRTMHGEPFNLVELPLPSPVYDEDGMRLPATYANYLVTPTHLFMPTYAQHENDFLAAQILKSVFPGHTIVGVDCRTYLHQHGSLHCATMQIPLSLLNL